MIAGRSQCTTQRRQARSDVALRLLRLVGDDLRGFRCIVASLTGHLVPRVVKQLAGTLIFLAKSVGDVAFRLVEIGGLSALIVLMLHEAT
ncbi:hypothetical protein X766_24500 [Mesorhizobium sp. LSJC255A00]|nr:hypothetical protein X766_24500 [Mesorhizobium sp. LSJC255A00]